MLGVRDIAEHLGYEVIEVEGEFVVRQRVNAHGKWHEREMRATALEVELYDTVRGLLMTSSEEAAVAPLHRIARVLGVPPTPSLTALEVLEKLAGLLANNRHWQEKANGTDRELVACRGGIQTLRAQLLDAKRLVPKGGDRGELLRQIRQKAADRYVGHEPGSSGYYRNQGEQNIFAQVGYFIEKGEWAE